MGMGERRNPEFEDILKEMLEIHNKKSHDYAMDTNVYSNFEFAASTAGVKVIQTFLVLIGVKLARLGQLIAGKEPKNESLSDTLLDLCTYCVIMYAYWRKANGLRIPEGS